MVFDNYRRGYFASMSDDNSRTGGRLTERDDNSAGRLAGILETILVAAVSVGAGWAVNALSEATRLWSALVSGAVGLLLFAALEQVKYFQDRSASSPARTRALRLLIALILAATTIIAADLASRRFPCALGFTNADILFCDDFRDATRGWRPADATGGAASYVHGGLELHANRGYALWDTAPADLAESAIHITAHARFAKAGAGAWGVWCRGTEDGATRYEFTVTHTGTAYIKIGDHADLYQVPNFHADEITTIEATCRDVIGGNGVQLTMKVNGDALTINRTAENEQVLGPGLVGAHAATFGDVPTAEPSIVFQLFLVERYRE
jgi:hypothetical protein